MKLKSLVFLALLPVLTSCAGECARTIQFEGFRMGNVTIPAPVYINEERMPITWKLLGDNGKAFILTGRISQALDAKQYSLCQQLKTTGDKEKDALKAEYKKCLADIAELAEILESPVPEIPKKLGAWNERLKDLAKENTFDGGAGKKPAKGAQPAVPAAEKPENAAPAEPSVDETPEATPTEAAPSAEPPAAR